MKKFIYLLTFLIIPGVSNSIDEDFAVLSYKNTPLELLVVGAHSNVDRNIVSVDKFSEKVWQDYSLFLKGGLREAGIKAKLNSKNRDEFMSNVYYYLGHNESSLNHFFKKNISAYIKLVCHEYDIDTCEYYKKSYKSTSSISYIVGLFFDDILVPHAIRNLESNKFKGLIYNKLKERGVASKRDVAFSLIFPDFLKFELSD